MLKALIPTALVAMCCTVSACGPSPQQACASYGYAPGTQAFAACAERTAMANRQAAQQGLTNAAILSAPAPIQQPTRCQWFGQQWVCQ